MAGRYGSTLTLIYDLRKTSSGILRINYYMILQNSLFPSKVSKVRNVRNVLLQSIDLRVSLSLKVVPKILRGPFLVSTKSENL